MKIPFKQPIIFIDFETTGVNRELDRIVEYCLVKLAPSGERTTMKGYINPMMDIPQEAIKVHGITNEMVKDAPTFREVANDIFTFIKGYNIAGYGSNSFDIPLLYHEFNRCGITWDYSTVEFIDVGNIFKVQYPRDLSAAVRTYCCREHEGAHSAENDVNATIDVFLAQCQEDNMPDTIEEIALMSSYNKKILDLSGKFTYNDNGEVIFNFGQYKGRPVYDHLDYIHWMYCKDFSEDTKRICANILNKVY